MTAVLVTRPDGEADPLVAELRARGYRVAAVPAVATRPLPVDWPDLARYDWVVVTSASGVDSLPVLPPRGDSPLGAPGPAKPVPGAPPWPAGPRWAAIGQATARALKNKGAPADFVPPQADGAALARTLPDAAGARVLLVRASLADPDLPAGLRLRGANVDEITAYETVEGPAESAPRLRLEVAQPDLAAVVFASGSAVRGFVKLGGSALLPAITIGPHTTSAAVRAGFLVAAESEGPTVRQLADAVARAIPLEVGKDA